MRVEEIQHGIQEGLFVSIYHPSVDQLSLLEIPQDVDFRVFIWARIKKIIFSTVSCKYHSVDV